MTDEAMSPLRRRMIEDMSIRKFAPKTQHDYLQRVKNFDHPYGQLRKMLRSMALRRVVATAGLTTALAHLLRRHRVDRHLALTLPGRRANRIGHVNRALRASFRDSRP
jgi:hypothetical protein